MEKTIVYKIKCPICKARLMDMRLKGNETPNVFVVQDTNNTAEAELRCPRCRQIIGVKK